MNAPSWMALLLLVVATLLSNGMAFVGSPNNLIPYKQSPLLSAHQDESSSDGQVDRRSFLSVPLSSVILAGIPSGANAAKGAAEYDLEYYMRDLFMGNKKEGNLPVSNAPPAAPPRTLREPLLPLLLDDELQSSIPIQELARVTAIPIGALAEQVIAFRSKVAPAFQASHPWQKESVTDEYYFDLTCYALWKVASATIQDYAVRDKFVRSIGSRLLNEMVQRQFLSKQSIALFNKNDNKLTDLIPCVIEVLDQFQSTAYCSSYRLGDKNDEERSGLKVFDELDDEEISSPNCAGSVNCLVSIFDPATLGGSLQITGEGSRFSPDFVGPTLAALFERVGAKVDFESYFVDPVYRPNPKDFFPNERFYQFTIARKS
mmetsp:Transcript_1227/g.2228  ORF Transcript_1227/g.2228 Transcript_1227/m.2228 type:complete len:374 (-) Transcript_1227:73-1194(-)